MGRRLRSSGTAAVAVFIAVAGLGSGAPAPATPPSESATPTAVTASPNVVLILLDDTRTDDMDVLPAVNRRISAKGATFTNAVSPFSLCCPARATLLTGRYAHNHHVLSNHAPLGGWTKFRDANTIATWLDPTYRTALIGKYLNEYESPYIPPGWDEWMTPKGTYNYTYDRWFINGSNATIEGYQTDTIGDLSADFISRNAPAAEPFFLFTSIVAPHGGLPAEADDPPFPTPNVSPRYRDMDAGTPLTDPSFNEADVSDKPLRPAPLSESEQTGLVEVNAQRRESMRSANHATNQIIRALVDAGELGSTYVFFLSDNGFLMGEHRIRGGKVAPYEVSVKVPMSVRGPGITRGATVDTLVGLQDFAPTVLAAAGQGAAHTGPAADGIDVLPAVEDPTYAARRPIVIEAGPKSDRAADTDPYRFHGITARLDGDQYKLVRRESGFVELYDLERDPHELENRAGDPAYADQQQRMQARLDAYEWCAGRGCR